MKKTSRFLLCVVTGLALGLFGCEKAEPDPTSAIQPPPQEQAGATGQTQPAVVETEADKLLNAGIEARGGIEKLKSIVSWTSKTKGTYMNMPYTSHNSYTPDMMRMLSPATFPKRRGMAQGKGLQLCQALGRHPQLFPEIGPCRQSGI